MYVEILRQGLGGFLELGSRAYWEILSETGQHRFIPYRNVIIEALPFTLSVSFTATEIHLLTFIVQRQPPAVSIWVSAVKSSSVVNEMNLHLLASQSSPSRVLRICLRHSNPLPLLSTGRKVM